MPGRSIGRDYRSSFRKAVTLVHRYAYGVIISLQVYIEQCASAHEELHLSSEPLTDVAENELVEQSHQRLFPQLQEPSFIIAFLIIGNGEIQGEVVQFLHGRALSLDSRFDVFLEILRQGRYTQHHSRLQFLDTHRNVPQCLHRSLSSRHCAYGSAV